MPNKIRKLREYIVLHIKYKSHFFADTVYSCIIFQYICVKNQNKEPKHSKQMTTNNIEYKSGLNAINSRTLYIWCNLVSLNIRGIQTAQKICEINGFLLWVLSESPAEILNWRYYERSFPHFPHPQQ